MKQVELANRLGVSKAYISMIISGKKKPSKRITSCLNRLGVNQETVNFKAGESILSHARLPVPALPRERELASAIITETVNHENSIYCPKVHKTRGYL